MDPTLDQVMVLAPSLPRALAEIVLQEWIDTGDFGLAVAAMRAAPIYDDYFPGNR